MGTSNIPSAVPNTVIPSTDHNSLKDALLVDLVPRNSGGNAASLGGSLGQSSFRWLFGYIQKIFVGTAAQNITIEGDGSDAVIKVGGVENLRLYLGAPVLPTGMLSPYSGDTAPSGWLLCNGGEVSRTTYAVLYAVVGNRFGEGNGTTTFNKPDFRGKFLRGASLGTGADPDFATRQAMDTGGATGDNVGSIQPDATAVNGLDTVIHSRDDETLDAAGTGATAFKPNDTGAGNNEALFAFDAVMTGDAETRPINAYVNYLIKI